LFFDLADYAKQLHYCLHGLHTQGSQKLVALKNQPADIHIGVFIYDRDEGHSNPTGDAGIVYDLQF